MRSGVVVNFIFLQFFVDVYLLQFSVWIGIFINIYGVFSYYGKKLPQVPISCCGGRFSGRKHRGPFYGPVVTVLAGYVWLEGHIQDRKCPTLCCVSVCSAVWVACGRSRQKHKTGSAAD